MYTKPVKQQSNISSNGILIASRRFKLICTIDSNEDVDNIPEDMNVHIDWGGLSRTLLSNYLPEISEKLTYRLFIGSPNIGG